MELRIENLLFEFYSPHRRSKTKNAGLAQTTRKLERVITRVGAKIKKGNYI